MKLFLSFTLTIFLAGAARAQDAASILASGAAALFYRDKERAPT